MGRGPHSRFVHVFWVNFIQHSHLIENAIHQVPQAGNVHKWPRRRHSSPEILSIIEKSNAAAKSWGVGKKGPQTSCNSGFFAHQGGCSPHTEELRRSNSPSAFSIAVTNLWRSEHRVTDFLSGEREGISGTGSNTIHAQNHRTRKGIIQISVRVGSHTPSPAQTALVGLARQLSRARKCLKNNTT